MGPGHACLVVGEIAQAHDGSLGTAHAYIDAIARAGAHAVKLQTHIAAAESTAAEAFRVKFSPEDRTRYEYWRRMEFTAEQWAGLAAHAAERGLLFLSSPFSLEAVELLGRVGVPAWKVGAGEIGNAPMLERMARTGKPVILSSGLATWAELDDAVACIRDGGAPVAVLQCTSAYPCPPEKLGLNVLADLRARYGCPVGLSDHSAVIYSGLAAAALGANLVEVHVTFSRECFGPDVIASLTTEELRQLVEGIRFIEKAIASPVEKDVAAGDLAELRRLFAKSLVAARDLPAGHRLSPDDLRLKKPGTGLPAARLAHVVGRTLKRPLVLDTLLGEDDLE